MTFWLLLCLVAVDPPEQVTRPLHLPARLARAPGGHEFARSVEGLPLKEREERVVQEILGGNLPTSARTLHSIALERDGHRAVVEVSGDYLAVGSDDDHVLMPLSPRSAQKIADRVDCVLPTTRIVDAVYRAATAKLTPSPIPPSPAMTTMPVFLRHQEMISAQRQNHPSGGLVAGHKKDVVIANKAFDRPGRVAIHGWHKRDGEPIQPLYAGHVETWVDYSHGVRLVSRRILVDGNETTIDAVLADPTLAPLLSDEGVISRTRYSTESSRGTTREELRLDRGVRVVVDREEPMSDRPRTLVLYALPNGNDIEQTIGKRLAPGDDWHFDIQHIGAQTAFAREALGDREIVVAYLENDLKSWPAWRKRHGDAALVEVLSAVERKCGQARLVLSGHSGGGSLIFGLINALGTIPDRVDRIVFLDANYAYDPERHLGPLDRWLDRDESHRLLVFAYDDARALLDGKHFVSADGGTWGRSQKMLEDFRQRRSFTSRVEGNLTRNESSDRRICLLLLENPERKILHKAQVEQNGFIEGLLVGTPRENVGYRYLGPRAYDKHIPEPR